MNTGKLNVIIPALALAGITLLSSGCATVTTGSTQSITVVTLPDGAQCLMTRKEKTIGAISPTPGTISVGKSSKPINVVCEKDGYESVQKELDSSFQGATLGNILIGGVVGVVIDASSGAANKYPDSVHLVMTPHAFDSEEEKQIFFDEWRAKVASETETEIAELDKFVEEDDPEYNKKHQLIMESNAEKLEEISAKEATVEVKTPTPQNANVFTPSGA